MYMHILLCSLLQRIRADLEIDHLVGKYPTYPYQLNEDLMNNVLYGNTSNVILLWGE